MSSQPDAAPALDPDNPFAQPSTLPYGLPPLDRIRLEHLAPAFHAGIAEQRAQWEAVAQELRTGNGRKRAGTPGTVRRPA